MDKLKLTRDFRDQIIAECKNHQLTVKSQSNLKNNRGYRVDLSNDCVLNIFTTGTIQYQGKNVEVTRNLLQSNLPKDTVAQLKSAHNVYQQQMEITAATVYIIKVNENYSVSVYPAKLIQRLNNYTKVQLNGSVVYVMNDYVFNSEAEIDAYVTNKSRKLD